MTKEIATEKIDQPASTELNSTAHISDLTNPSTTNTMIKEMRSRTPLPNDFPDIPWWEDLFNRPPFNPPDMSEEYNRRVFQAMDTNNDKALSRKEFIPFGGIKEFNKTDKNHNGVISFKELKSLMSPDQQS